MGRLRYIAFTVALGYLLSPSMGMASLVSYDAFGSVKDRMGSELPITGEVHIDDQLRDWDGNGPGLPTEIHDQTGSWAYQYYITGYSLSVGEYSFTGDSGMIYLTLERFPTLEDWGIGDLMWFLEDGHDDSQWQAWTGEHFTFKNADGTPQDFSQYSTLADTIDLSALMYLYKDPILADGPHFELRLVRDSPSVPVPEPSVTALMGVSAIGLFLRRRRRLQRGSPSPGMRSFTCRR